MEVVVALGRGEAVDEFADASPETVAVALGRLAQHRVVKLASRLPVCVIAMEACCGAHHLGRLLQACGHEIRLISPEYVQPYVEAQKNMA